MGEYWWLVFGLICLLAGLCMGFAVAVELEARRSNGLVFRGKAARWLSDYLENAEPDPLKAERAKRDKEIVAQMRPLSELRKPQQGGEG